MNGQLRALNRTLGRLISAIVFAALLFSGVLVRPTDEVLGWVLMGAAILPLVHLVATWRGR